LRPICCKSKKLFVSTVKSKAKVITRRTSLVDARVFGELKKTGAIIMGGQSRQYLCISCAIHSGNISQRTKSERKNK
jgi:ribosomal protein S26